MELYKMKRLLILLHLHTSAVDGILRASQSEPSSDILSSHVHRLYIYSLPTYLLEMELVHVHDFTTAEIV